MPIVGNPYIHRECFSANVVYFAGYLDLVGFFVRQLPTSMTVQSSTSGETVERKVSHIRSLPRLLKLVRLRDTTIKGAD